MTSNVPHEPVDLAEVRAMSRRIGTDISLVQGAGGNTSIKDDGVLWVKASGTWLSDAEEKNIMVPVDLALVNSILESGSSDFGDATLAGELRPSIETSLHCQLRHRVVVHVHSVSGIARSVQKDARDSLDRVLEGVNWCYVPYAMPGASLTSVVSEVLTGVEELPDLLVLENHGLVLGGPSCVEVEALLRDVEDRLNLLPREVSEPDVNSIALALLDCEGWRLPSSPDIHGIALDESTTAISVGGALIPDHAVFLEKPVPVSNSPGEIAATLTNYRDAVGDEADWMIVRGVGVILSSRLGAAGEAQLRGLASIALRIPEAARVRYIDDSAARELRSWDAEIYRKRLDEELTRGDE